MNPQWSIQVQTRLILKISRTIEEDFWFVVRQIGNKRMIYYLDTILSYGLFYNFKIVD